MRNNTREIVTAVTVLTIAGIVAVVVASANGEDQAALIIGSVIGLLAPTVTALLAFMKSSTNQDQLTVVTHKVDDAAVLARQVKTTLNETDAVRYARDNVDISLEKAVVVTPKEHT